jgi:hypothetical protein
MHTASPLFSRALLALTAAATIAVTPFAATAIAPADSGQSAHSIPAYLIARISHDVGHNDWAFQGQNAGRVGWAVTYAALALFWLAVSVWIGIRSRRASAAAVDGAAVEGAPEVVAAVAPAAVPAEGRRVRLWLRVLVAAWGTELIVALLTLGAGAYAEWTSTSVGAGVLRVADLCSPWWSCVAAMLVVARAERSTTAVRAAAGYAALLVIVLLVPLPGPDAVKVLLLAVPAAVPAILTPRPPEPTEADLTRGAVAAG